MGAAFQTANWFAALAVLWGSVCALNGMHRHSPLILRTAHVLIAVGAAGVLIAPLYLDRGPTVAEMLLVYGAAVFSVNRICKCQMPGFLLSLHVRLSLLREHPAVSFIIRQVERLSDAAQGLYRRVRQRLR